MELNNLSSGSNNHHHHKERSRKTSKVNPVPEVKIQIERDVSSRTSSSHGRNHRGDLSDGTLTENSCSENPWSRDVKQGKVYHSKPEHRKATSKNLKMKQESSHHSFLTDTADMRSMETALIQLVNDFHSGKLQAFGRHCSTEQMEAIRDQQEKLARLHFELGAQHDINTQHTNDNMNELVAALEHLSQTIEQLHPHASQSQSDSN